MNVSYSYKFFTLYWQYIISVLVCYITSKFIISCLKSNTGTVQKQTEFKTSDEEAELMEIPLEFSKIPQSDMMNKSIEFYTLMNKRRTVRHFSTKSVSAAIIRNIIKTADAPCLILVFKQMYSVTAWGSKKMHYYNEISVGIAAGILISAIHCAGLVSLTSTPLNCGPALRTLLNRPANEKLTLLLPVGYPAEDCMVPDLKRKALKDILIEL